jgi:hypothetical protein
LFNFLGDTTMRYSARALAALVVAFAFTAPAQAWTVDLNHSVTTTYAGPLNPTTFVLNPFAVTGTVVYQDDFAGSTPDSNEMVGGTGSYATGATQGALSESGGVVTMDLANSPTVIGGLTGSANNAAKLRPLNDYSSVLDNKLYRTDIFATASAFSIVNPDPKGQYGIRLRDGSPTGNSQIDFASLSVRTNGSGNTSIAFRTWVGNDYTVDPVGSWVTIDSVSLLAPTNATDIILALIKPFDTDDVETVGINESKQVFAAYAFYDSLTGLLSGATLLNGSKGLFHGEGWTQMEQFAGQVVPEPSTWLLMGIGLLGLLVASRRRLS